MSPLPAGEREIFEANLSLATIVDSRLWPCGLNDRQKYCWRLFLAATILIMDDRTSSKLSERSEVDEPSAQAGVPVPSGAQPEPALLPAFRPPLKKKNQKRCRPW